MRKNTIDFHTVRDIGLALSGVEESTAYGSPALKVHGKLMAGIAVNRSAEPGSLGICVDFDDRAELLAPAPRYLLRDGPLRPLQRRAGSPVSRQSRYVARQANQH